jgi:hypothetical protein
VRPCLIDGILPTNAVHLLGGSPGAGKTRFTFGLINDWQTGNKFLGHNCSPVPYCFISLDRPRASVEETLETMDLKGQITRLLCLDEVPDDPTLAVTMTAAVKKYPDSQMFFIEGFQLFAGDLINRYTPVARLLKGASKRCSSDNRTVLGVCHASKTKEGAKFLKGRDRIGGTVAWSAFSETIIIVDADEQTKVRTVDIYPRNSPEERHELMMTKGGVLVPCPKEKGERLLLQILAIPEGFQVLRQWALDIAESMQIGTATVDRVLKRCVDDSVLEPVSDGIYKRVFTT